ncbi:MAG: hypothetical protein H7Y30_16065, partial [Pyrinomonadaceae bacterium]|nr:hypothetical protein [Pyrinomonadaceae bacterium]
MDVNQYRKEFAAYSSQIERAHYLYRAGLDEELHVQPIYDRYGGLFTTDAIESLQQAKADAPAHLETEQVGLRALTGAACIGYLEAQAKDLTDELARCESAAHVSWEGESLAAHSVPKTIANEPRAASRR